MFQYAQNKSDKTKTQEGIVRQFFNQLYALNFKNTCETLKKENG